MIWTTKAGVSFLHIGDSICITASVEGRSWEVRVPWQPGQLYHEVEQRPKYAAVDAIAHLVLVASPRDLVQLFDSTMTQLADRLGVGLSSVSMWAHGRRRMDKRTRYAVLGLLGLSYDKGSWRLIHEEVAAK